MSDALKVNTAGAVTTLHLDDGKANALGFELIESIRDALAAAESDPNVGAVVISGSPRGKGRQKHKAP